VLHRVVDRLSGGRIGLSLPEAGHRFGMMRLTTVGRRSGQSRVAIVGYYRDGENLVTLVGHL
jgi:F420H(2)-dependent quinone reductase